MILSATERARAVCREALEDHREQLIRRMELTGRTNAHPVTRVHSCQQDVTLSPSSMDLLSDPRAWRLLNELGYFEISVAAPDYAARRPLPEAEIRRFKSKSAPGVSWYASKHTCNCRGHKFDRPCVHVLAMRNGLDGDGPDELVDLYNSGEVV